MPIFRSHRLRTGRFSEQSRLYLVTLVVRQREPVFNDWSSARPLIVSMKACQAEGGADSLCWVIMPDHFHWLMELKGRDLAGEVARLKSRSTVLFNRANQRVGSLWQKGFHDRALRREEDVKSVARYIVANPLRAGLAERIGDYPLWDAVWLQ
ncbi:REP-associated tyrosine transposase [Pseudomonas sp. RIT-To-2]|uniref:REP-associated tyrosine transposase n=1 Tax=Pseudomonas sp. RIT-To-2 TaxID=3462541 RepID=UPI0024131207